MKKIQNGFEANQKRAENISKFSRRTANCFRENLPKRIESKKPLIQKRLKTLRFTSSSTRNTKNTQENEKNQEKSKDQITVNQEKFIDGGTIEESKTFEETGIKQENSKDQLNTNIININIEKSVNLDYIDKSFEKKYQ